MSPTPASTPSPRYARCRICRLDLMDDRRCPRCGVRDRRTDPINPAWRAQRGLTKEGRVDPVTIQVHCEQHLHPIRFDGHQLHFPAHELGSLQFLAALQTDNRCAEIWREVHRRRTLGTSPRSWSYRIPPPLRRVLMLRLSLKRQTHHGEHLTPAAAWDLTRTTLHTKALRRSHGLYLRQVRAQGFQVYLTPQPETPYGSAARLMPGTDTKATSHWASTRRPVACYQDGCWIVDPSAVHEALSRVRRFVDYTHTSWTTWEAAHGRENPRRNSWGFRMRSETIAEATQRLEMISASANRLHAGRRQGQAPREAPAPAPDPAPPAPQPKQSGPPPPAAQAPKRRAHASRQLALFPT